MAGQVPTTAPPAYGASLGNVMTNAAQGRAGVLDSELKAQSTNLGHILGNIDKIAEVGGGEFTPDRLLAAFGGAKQDILPNDYSGMMDRLRAQEMQANIGRLNRSGKGGSGGSSKAGGKPGQWLVRDRNTGIVTWFDPADKDAQVLNDLTSGNDSRLEVLQYGTDTGIPDVLPDLNSTGTRTQPNGTIEMLNGVKVEWQGGQPYNAATGDPVNP